MQKKKMPNWTVKLSQPASRPGPDSGDCVGDVNDPNSWGFFQSRSFELRLSELNTRPRTTYQGKLKNPNPEIEPA
jgi:hypothetical protein